MVSHLFERASRPVFTGIICLLAGNLCAQGKHDYRKSADNFYAQGDYYSAVLYYEKSIDTKGQPNKAGFNPYVAQANAGKENTQVSGREQSIYRIAESYRHLKDYINAEKWYHECLALDSNQFPLLRLWLAMCLRANEKYAGASSQLSQFLDTYKTDDVYLQKARLELANCRFIETQLSGKKRVEIQKLEGAVNQANSNYAPSLLNGQWLVFTSTRTDSGLLQQKNRNPHKNGLFRVKANDLSAPAEKMNLAELPDIDQGTSSFTSDSKKVFFTRWTTEQGKKKASIYYSQQESGKWSEPVKLGNAVNPEGYSSQQPFVSADGKQLFFASDMPGGLGGFDIWYVTLEANANLGKPVNLGKMINTPEDEQAPFYYLPGKTLVFASKGRVGMGGFDLYGSTGDITGWSEPVNPGSPINSVKDDIYFAAAGSRSVWEEGYLSSDRNTTCCLEVFRFKKIKTIKQITGLVVDCNTQKALPGASIKLSDPAGNGWSLLLQSDANGAYHFELPEYRNIKVSADKSHYTTATLLSNNLESWDADSLVYPVICLTPIPELDTAGFWRPRMVYFDFNKSELRASEKEVLDSLIQLLKKSPALTLEMFGYTDGKGSDLYNQKLSDARVKTCLDYLAEKGIETERLILKGNGECCPLEAEQSEKGTDNPAARGKNRRVEFRITGY